MAKIYVEDVIMAGKKVETQRQHDGRENESSAERSATSQISCGRTVTMEQYATTALESIVDELEGAVSG